MKNKNSNSIPHRYHDHPINPWKCPTEDGGEFHYMGLTKREYFAGLAMQAILSNEELRIKCLNDSGIYKVNRDVIVEKMSVIHADELLKQLEKE